MAILTLINCPPRSRNYIAALIVLLKFLCRTLKCFALRPCVWAAKIKICALDCVTTLKKLIENTIAVSVPSWITRWTISIAGWSRFSPTATRMLLVSILTRSTRTIGRSLERFHVNFSFRQHSPSVFFTRTVALCLSISLLLGDASTVFAQPSPQSKTRTHSKKKSKKPKAVPCKADCGVSTSAPEITSPTLGDAAAQTELASLARGLHTAVPGSYEKLSSFATKNSSTVWGGRAALTLGYEDYTRNRLPQALNWFAKAKKAALLSEYVLYWSAQAKRGQKNMSAAFADLQTFRQEYPNSAMREQFLEAYRS